MKDDYAIVKRLKSGETVPTGSVPVDLVRTAAGALHISTPSGPQELVHAANINTVLQSAGGAGWEKVQITTATYQLKPSTSGASQDFHLEAGGGLAVLEVADWPLPVSPKVDVLKIRNFSGTTQIFQLGSGYSGLVTHDDNPATPVATSYSIRNDGMVVVSIDSDGWVQVVPSAEVSQAEHDTLVAAVLSHGFNTSNPHTVTKAQVQLGNATNTSDADKPVSTAQQTALDGKSATSHAHTGVYEPSNSNIQAHVISAHAPADADATVVNNTLTSTSTSEALSAAQGKALQDGKQSVLTSGANIKTINGATLLGAGNITTSADLAGGSDTTITNEGLVSTGADSVDTTTVPGETIIRYIATTGTAFTAPLNVTSVRVLAVAGGGGGGVGIGGGGGGGGVIASSSVPVSGSVTVIVGTGGLGRNTDGAGANGGNSVFGSITATGGGGGGGWTAAGQNGGSGGGGNSGNANFTAAGTGTQGSDGGVGEATIPNGVTGGGGGGAGGVGAVGGIATSNGLGGVGISNDIIGTATFYGGGGGAGLYMTGATTGPRPGGNGGGGAGNGISTASVAGTTSTGGGGGGNQGSSSAAGGSGIVIVRFATQIRTYKALQSYANNAAAIAAGRLMGEFFINTTTGGIAQVA